MIVLICDYFSLAKSGDGGEAFPIRSSHLPCGAFSLHHNAPTSTRATFFFRKCLPCNIPRTRTANHIHFFLPGARFSAKSRFASLPHKLFPCVATRICFFFSRLATEPTDIRSRRIVQLSRQGRICHSHS